MKETSKKKHTPLSILNSNQNYQTIKHLASMIYPENWNGSSTKNLKIETLTLETTIGSKLMEGVFKGTNHETSSKGSELNGTLLPSLNGSLLPYVITRFVFLGIENFTFFLSLSLSLVLLVFVSLDERIKEEKESDSAMCVLYIFCYTNTEVVVQCSVVTDTLQWKWKWTNKRRRKLIKNSKKKWFWLQFTSPAIRGHWWWWHKYFYFIYFLVKSFIGKQF